MTDEQMIQALADIRDQLVRNRAAPASVRPSIRVPVACRALLGVARMARCWAEGAVENDEALGRRNVKPADEQPFLLADVLSMINDAARELGMTDLEAEIAEAAK